MPPIHDDYPIIPKFPSGPMIAYTDRQVKCIPPPPTLIVNKVGVSTLRLEWKIRRYDPTRHTRIDGYGIWALCSGDYYPHGFWLNVDYVETDSPHMSCKLHTMSHLGMLYLAVVAVDEDGYWSNFSNINEMLITGIEGGHLKNIKCLRRFRYFNNQRD